MAKSEKVEKKKVSRIKIKKKLWYKIISPKVFGQREIGESYLGSPDEALGRIVKANLKDLSGNVKDQNVYIRFQINNIAGNTLETAVTGYELTTSYIKRTVRKNTNRMDDYFVFKTKGGREVVIKTLMVTLNKVQQSVLKLLRKQLREMLQEEVNKSGFDNLISNLVTYKVQGTIKKRLGKVYPLKELAIRMLFLKEKGLVSEEIFIDEPKEKETTGGSKVLENSNEVEGAEEA